MPLIIPLMIVLESFERVKSHCNQTSGDTGLLALRNPVTTHF